MNKVQKFLLSLVFVLMLALQMSAQSLLKDGTVPEDLVIILKMQQAWSGGYSEITINAKGEFSHTSRGGLPVTDYSRLLLKGHKLTKYLKPKLSIEKLKLLIAEFDKIKFFKFGKDFPVEEKETLSVSDAGGESIFIQINGQNKEVSNYLGDFTKRRKLLSSLAERIRGSRIWNFENDSIPENFELHYRITERDKIIKDFKINAKGNVIETIFLNKFYPNVGKELPYLKESKKIGKLSKQQLRQLLDEFEKVNFSTFLYSILEKYDGCSNDPSSAGSTRKSINVQINDVSQMFASLYDNCKSTPETNAAIFESITKTLEETLRTAKAKL
jgi:hypothetical protein